MIEIDTAISQIRSSANNGQLVVVAGTGVSMALTGGKNNNLSWKGLVENGFNYGVAKGKITLDQSIIWRNQLNSSDLDDLLSAAEFMGRKLEAPTGVLYARWLEAVFKDVRPEEKGMANAIHALTSSGIPICTLNYDFLLERVSGLHGINLSETGRVTAWMRREEQGILHLHGTWDAPSTCILGIRDYETTLLNEMRDLIQRALTSFGRLLFVGCGDTFADPNFSALIKWLTTVVRTGAPQHYALVGASDLERRHADNSWHGFVEPLSYGASHADLPAFLLNLFPTKSTAPPPSKSRSKQKIPSISSAKRERIIADYRAFLISDCGQMTIEGIRADMDTAQRRFDLEKLFVPLRLLPSPPEISNSDPDRDQKLLKWHDENREPLDFGKVFNAAGRMALLALPGGGKTLLLKRLAVAYADPRRRTKSGDSLPELELLPVLIRCREWKEYIRRPISVLLQNIANITGQLSLSELWEALQPLLKKGQLLLLVDGLDEIHNDADRASFVENLENFLQEHKLIRLVVTSREAGFGLVAPSLARFCERWRVAPLEPDSIKLLCDYWHGLMVGDTDSSSAESRDVAERIIQNDAVHRLAENPLLLTMLLVVKHGAGRLPPDRVSLYDRAIEVLLDTWNIKGHEPLNLKEAVPQLACVAFQLMSEGRQTATEKELLAILDEARGKVDQIRRYAKDTPAEFLRRVELRSSLLVEAGHQLEGIKTVPFYQFRHLTFQEHLAAVASAEGHYIGYKKNHSVLTPLQDHLLSERWKEVVPMAAVLARKQAEPLMAALVAKGTALRQKFEQGELRPGSSDWESPRLPVAVSRLTQCLAEEAEASPEILQAALQVIALFARGCKSPDNWLQLIRGPYAADLLHEAWLLYEPMSWPPDSWLRNTIAVFSANRRTNVEWQSEQAQSELVDAILDEKIEIAGRALLTVAGFYWGQLQRNDSNSAAAAIKWIPLTLLEKQILREEDCIWNAATWAWALSWKNNRRAPPPVTILDRLLERWSDPKNSYSGISEFALSKLFGIDRDAWTPRLTETQQEQVKRITLDPPDEASIDEMYNYQAALFIAYHTKSVWSDTELLSKFELMKRSARFSKDMAKMISQLSGRLGGAQSDRRPKI
jgi:hypothetical protein